jgi:hypothetical protein
MDGALMNAQTYANLGTISAEIQPKRLTVNRYDAALALLRPMLSTPESRNGAGFYRALNQLQKAYPELSGNEIEALVTAVLRGLQNRDNQPS